MTARTFPLLPALCTFIAACILCALGTWQLQRLEWKTTLINQLNAEYAHAEKDTVFSPNELKNDFLFRRRTVQGIYAFNKEILIGPRVHQEEMGFHVITPIKLSDGSWLLADRGWVPQNWREDFKTPKNDVSIGLLRHPDAANPFTPANHPDKNQWYNLNPNEIAAAKGLKKISAYVLYIEGEPRHGQYPIPQDSKPQLTNNHLLYAIFWFSMSGALLIIFILRFRKQNAA